MIDLPAAGRVRSIPRLARGALTLRGPEGGSDAQADFYFARAWLRREIEKSSEKGQQ